jgi:hypothetical protein
LPPLWLASGRGPRKCGTAGQSRRVDLGRFLARRVGNAITVVICAAAVVEERPMRAEATRR